VGQKYQSQAKNKSEQPLALGSPLHWNVLVVEFRDFHNDDQMKMLCLLLHMSVGESHCTLKSSASVIYQGHTTAGQRKTIS